MLYFKRHLTINIVAENNINTPDTIDESEDERMAKEHREAELMTLDIPGVRGFYASNEPLSVEQAEVMRRIIEKTLQTPLEELKRNTRKLFMAD